jgi:hypothetical protein
VYPVTPTLSVETFQLRVTCAVVAVPVRPVGTLGAIASFAQTFAVPPPPQYCGAVHEPQLRLPPQPSLTLPQVRPSPAQVLGVHVVPHTFGWPAPPHVAGEVQLPQLRVPPQPSLTEPQLKPRTAQVVGVQALAPMPAWVSVSQASWCVWS